MTWKPYKVYSTYKVTRRNKMQEKEYKIEDLIRAYEELKSSYKVAKKFSISATAVKRILKSQGVLRTQAEAAKERDNSHLDYERTETHKKRLSELGKQRVGNKNPFFNKTHSLETRNKISEFAKTRVAKRNPNYKNGEYQRRPRDFKQAEFTRLRNFVFNRDDYTCNYCKRTGGHMHAHHKIPYWVKPEAFLDDINLITTCTECHFVYAHQSNWAKFDQTLIDERLLKKYNLDRERLNELAGQSPDAIVRPPDINETGEVVRNELPPHTEE